MKYTYVERNFSESSLGTITTVNSILDQYAHLGYDLSLRQLYYQMVARGYIENSDRSYKNLGSLVSDSRLAGYIDWNMIQDRGRETIMPPRWKDPAEIVAAAASQFAIDRWENQVNHIEVMVEKQALEGVLIPVCRETGVNFSANKGYSSSSTMYQTGRRVQLKLLDGKDVYILYLGDHDPSGIDMTRDVGDRVRLFAEDEQVEVMRLALNFDQIEILNPPENPAKTTDSRARAYIAEFGMSSWELDAIEPTALADLVRRAVESLRDEDLWRETLQREALMRAELGSFVKSYSERNEPKAKAKPRRKK